MTALEKLAAEYELLKKQHPGFTITCDKCGSRRIEINNSMGFSELSGSWGSIDLICLNCNNETDIMAAPIASLR